MIPYLTCFLPLFPLLAWGALSGVGMTVAADRRADLRRSGLRAAAWMLFAAATLTAFLATTSPAVTLAIGPVRLLDCALRPALAVTARGALIAWLLSAAFLIECSFDDDASLHAGALLLSAAGGLWMAFAADLSVLTGGWMLASAALLAGAERGLNSFAWRRKWLLPATALVLVGAAALIFSAHASETQVVKVWTLAAPARGLYLTALLITAGIGGRLLVSQVTDLDATGALLYLRTILTPLIDLMLLLRLLIEVLPPWVVGDLRWPFVLTAAVLTVAGGLVATVQLEPRPLWVSCGLVFQGIALLGIGSADVAGVAAAALYLFLQTPARAIIGLFWADDGPTPAPTVTRLSGLTGGLLFLGLCGVFPTIFQRCLWTIVRAAWGRLSFAGLLCLTPAVIFLVIAALRLLHSARHGTARHPFRRWVWLAAAVALLIGVGCWLFPDFVIVMVGSPLSSIPGRL